VGDLPSSHGPWRASPSCAISLQEIDEIGSNHVTRLISITVCLLLRGDSHQPESHDSLFGAAGLAHNRPLPSAAERLRTALHF
jgi:hypothetical protein